MHRRLVNEVIDVVGTFFWRASTEERIESVGRVDQRRQIEEPGTVPWSRFQLTECLWLWVVALRFTGLSAGDVSPLIDEMDERGKRERMHLVVGLLSHSASAWADLLSVTRT